MLLAALLALPALALLLLAAHLAHAGLMPLAALAILLVGLLARSRPELVKATAVLVSLTAAALGGWMLVGLHDMRRAAATRRCLAWSPPPRPDELALAPALTAMRCSSTKAR